MQLKVSYGSLPPCMTDCCIALQRVAVCCSVLQRVAACCSVLPCVADATHFVMTDFTVNIMTDFPGNIPSKIFAKTENSDCSVRFKSNQISHLNVDCEIPEIWVLHPARYRRGSNFSHTSNESPFCHTSNESPFFLSPRKLTYFVVIRAMSRLSYE